MCKACKEGDLALRFQARFTKNIEFSLETCVKVEKKVIWHYVLRRDLEVLNAPALHWLWFGAQECTALEGEGR